MYESPTQRTILAGVSSVTAAFVVHPIDTIKIRLQIQGELGLSKSAYNNTFVAAYHIIIKENIFGLYKGLLAAMLRESTYSTLRLGLYEPLKIFFGATDPNNTPLYKKIAAGVCSGCLGAIPFTPCDVIKIRVQSNENHLKLREIFYEIYRTKGVLGYYQGVYPSTIRAALVTATQLSTYDHMKHGLINHNILNDGMFCNFVSSMMSGVMCALTTSPIDLVKTRIMNQRHDNILYNGIIDCFIKTYKAEGFKGLYKGFTPQWMRIGPITTISLVVWEFLRKELGLRGI
jgi:hypothetical protein